MSEETKAPTPPPSGEPKDSAGKPNPPSVEPVPAKKPGDPTAPATPGAPGAPSKAAAPHAPAAPAKPTGPTPEPWNSALVATLKRQYGSGIREASTYLGQNCMRSEEHTSELQSRGHLVCRLLLEKKKI